MWREDAKHAVFEGSLSAYSEHLAQRIARHKSEFSAADSSALFFRISAERFALPTIAVREVVDSVRFHTVPRLANPSILGLVTVRGELMVCAALNRLLGLHPPGNPAKKLLVLCWNGAPLACFVDEVLGVSRFKKEHLGPRPPGVGSVGGLVLGMIEIQTMVASVLSVDSLFATVQHPASGATQINPSRTFD